MEKIRLITVTTLILNIVEVLHYLSAEIKVLISFHCLNILKGKVLKEVLFCML